MIDFAVLKRAATRGLIMEEQPLALGRPNAEPLSRLALGSFILLLSAGWQPLRGAFLRTLPPRFAAWLPHPIGA